MKKPCLVVSDSCGNIFEIPELLMAASSCSDYCVPAEDSLIALPVSSVFHTLPGRLPIGYDAKQRKFVAIDSYDGEQVFAVSAFMPPGYLQTYNSACNELPDAPRLPLFCYTAVGWKNGTFYAAGLRIDRQLRHEIADTDMAKIDKSALAMRKQFAENRIISHLVDNCVFKYRCPNACNLVLGKWECPIPVSRSCNAECLGCISKQPKSSCVPSTQHRLDFKPTAEEIAQYVVPHLQKAQNPIASFGQGCEGEPLLESSLIEDSIIQIRKSTRRGVININTNGSKPDAVKRLCEAGLNSMRVSLNSAQPDFYNAYYRPKKYSFDDVYKSIKIARKYNVWVSINYLVFPGFTDSPAEMSALKKLLRETNLNMIQTRNLNIDPAWYVETLSLHNIKKQPIGMVAWVKDIKNCFPDVKLGYFNPTCAMVRAKR